MHIPFFFLIILFVIWLGYETRKHSGQQAKESKNFWDRESDSLLTPRKPLDDVNFITIPDEIIPETIVSPSSDAEREINDLADELKTLQSKKIADLSAYTNTDLRLKYGVPNFAMLMDADTCFGRLVQIMPAIISNLLDAGRKDDAARVFDFCRTNGIDSNMLRKLADSF